LCEVADRACGVAAIALAGRDAGTRVHEKKTITYGLYASGSEQKQKLAAISKVAYPAPLNRP
jgi:hypothetical protein